MSKCECGGFIIREIDFMKVQDEDLGSWRLRMIYPNANPSSRYYCLTCNKDHTVTKLAEMITEELLKGG